ncbi:hypothetical protein Q4530_02785 [Colwellia sp. 1_MG-2023]|uniref:hypothetical protein n=1 Tax=unclassified Colwellia TaxID=196834 RepID=UPI001C09814A|nr:MULTISPECIES: hypothetical protein [unclassified Colwellia]MBU2923194.1 hypothetical protein [Colwellia sp. C2M11]MDO6651376.1 hypothetical protein [Colwellia sp. 3_MG-2023]MDO6664201.1 hypothetical protein [Colwellia sp. 2_MG-2023]MDO6688685.1 hypothetical protein [Colwellia sp. 1_MG-2023]
MQENMDMAFAYPKYLEELVERLVKRNWLVHNFPKVDNTDVYNFANYRQNKLVNNVIYTVYLDVNIYQFIINSIKKNSPKEEFKDAIALVAFCQIAEIELDPTYAVYEKLNYSNDQALLDELTTDLELFQRINNTSNELLAQYSLGFIEKFTPSEGHNVEHEKVQKGLTKYRRLIEWDSMYLMILYITNTSLIDALNKKSKLKKLIEWMIKEFRLSLVVIVFAIIYFGDKPLRRMMKVKLNDSPERKLKSLFNMTWDLYTLNRYFRMWTEREPQQEGIYASNDKVFNEILRGSIDVQNSEELTHFEGHIDKKDIQFISEMTMNQNHSHERMYDSEEWSHEYRARLIKKHEKLLGVDSKATS